MKKLLNVLKNKNWGIAALNLFALLAVIQNVNVTCGWVHHQPEVPEEAKRFRKF